MLSPTRRRALTAVLATALGLLACPPAWAGPPTDRLRDFFAKVNAILADPTIEDQPLERVARVRRLVADVADMTAASAAALGPEWETKNPAERDEFTTLFAEVLERAYVGRLAGAVRATGGLTMTYRDEVLAGSEATVKTALRGRGGHDLRVEYLMTLRGGRWRVRDIVVDGVSTVENYHAQFRRLRQQGSYVALVAQMRDKLTEESLMFTRVERPTPAIASMPSADREIAAAPPAAPEPVSSPSPPVREPVPAARTVSRSPRAEPIRPAPPVVVAVARPISVTARTPVMASPVAATPAPGGEPNILETALGALLLGAIGAGSATFLRRRAHPRVLKLTRRGHRPR